jgi:hypothetical protein
MIDCPYINRIRGLRPKCHYHFISKDCYDQRNKGNCPILKEKEWI